MEKLHYFIQANIYLTLSWIFYTLILKKETFHQWNRAFIMGSGVGSLLLPLFSEKIAHIWLSPPVIPQEELPTWVLPAVEISAQVNTRSVASYEYLYWIGFGVSCLVLLLRLLKTYQLFQRKEVGAWSFLGHVFVHHQLPNFRTILLHERIHARQFHTLDVLFWEVTTLVFWMNPVVYALRHAIRQVHEFIADDRAARSMKDRTEYATLLVHHQLGSPLLSSLEHPFYSHANLKSRITMIMKKPSHRVALLKYGFIVPLFGLGITLSSARLAETTQPEVIQNQWQTLQSQGEAAILTRGTEAKITSKPRIASNSPDTTKLPKQEVLKMVDVVPQFPGGVGVLYQWIGKNIQYPADAIQDKKQGKVFVRFIVDSNGKIQEAEVMKGVCPSLDAEALRIVRAMPTWIPGQQNGKPAAVYYNLPIAFSLGESPEPLPKSPTPPSPPAAPGNSSLPKEGKVIFTPVEKDKVNQGISSITIVEKYLPEKRTTGNASSPKASDVFPENAEIYVDDQRIERNELNLIEPSKIKSVTVDKKGGNRKIFIELKKND